MYKLLLVVVALSAVGGGIYLYQGTRTEIEPVIHGQEATTTPGTITLTTLAKDVYLTQKDSLDVKKVEKTATTSTGSTVRTSATGRALLVTTQKKMVLDHDTQITIPSENNAQVSRIVLLGGSIWSRVEKIFEKGEYYEIQTQNMVAAVRGTSFNVTYKDGVTTVEVEESAVAVTPLDPKTGARMEDKTVVIPQGKKAAVDQAKGNTTVVSDLTAKDKSDSWFDFNVQLEKDAEKNAPPSNVPPPAPVATPKPLPTPTPTPVVPSPTPVPPPALTPTPPPPTSGGSDTFVPGAPIALARITPTSVSAKSGEVITLSGSGLHSVVSLSLVAQNDLNPIDMSFKVVTDTTITFTLPSGVMPGLYNIVGVSAMEQGSSLDRALTVF
ncbi:MAG TPA: FecR domain-containing protein [Candidatus Paceibacterota bacterium]|nr:FecR domain-containing protein [Candidatus Paceibacterota bacterium]